MTRTESASLQVAGCRLQGRLTIYIAASWRHEHAVELLTRELEGMGHEVISFVRFAVRVQTGFDLAPKLDEWIASADGARKLAFNLKGATESDLVIYLGPSGPDAWAEIGAAWAAKRTIIGLTAKGEQIGLCRRMVTAWAASVDELLASVRSVAGWTQDEELKGERAEG